VPRRVGGALHCVVALGVPQNNLVVDVGVRNVLHIFNWILLARVIALNDILNVSVVIGCAEIRLEVHRGV
jgi:hypothetical protein